MKRCLSYFAILIATVIGLVSVVMLDSDTDMITGNFVKILPESTSFLIPIAVIALVFIAFFSVRTCKRK